MLTVVLSDESVSTFSLIYLPKSESQKGFVRFADGTVPILETWLDQPLFCSNN